MLVRYESYKAFLDVARDIPVRHQNTNNIKWAGGTFSQAINKATSGDESLVAQAQMLINHLELCDFGAHIDEWQSSVCGAYPVVPEYLAGHPLCMRTKSPGEKRTPISIYVCTTISAGLYKDQIEIRGSAILALVLKLQERYPVNLYVTAETHGATDGDYIQVIPIESRPISLAHACNALTGTSFARQLTYGIAEWKDGFNGNWGSHATHAGRNLKWISEQLGITENDLYIKAGHIHDPLINNPIQWLNEQLKRYAELEQQ